jgi:hypothetical protein
VFHSFNVPTDPAQPHIDSSLLRLSFYPTLARRAHSPAITLQRSFLDTPPRDVGDQGGFKAALFSLHDASATQVRPPKPRCPRTDSADGQTGQCVRARSNYSTINLQNDRRSGSTHAKSFRDENIDKTNQGTSGYDFFDGVQHFPPVCA